MKKTFLAILVAATLVACAKEDVISQNNEAIGFKQAFVDNSVRSVEDPSLNATSLQGVGFDAYAFVEKNVLLSDEDVTFDGDWGYSNTQYWINGAQYNFCAIAPTTGKSWEVTSKSVDTNYDATFVLSFTNDGTEDLLFANAGKIQGQAAGSNSTVGFTFGHLLSKVKFSFENAYNASNATIKVSNVHITNAHKSATATVTAPGTLEQNVAAYSVVWGSLSTPIDLNFGDAVADDVDTVADAFAYGTTLESYKELLLIPSAEYEYNVTFHVDLLVSGNPVNAGYNHTATVKFAPAAGYSYNIKAEVSAENIDPDNEQEEIVFTVTEVEGWKNGNTTDDSDPKDDVNDSLPLPLN